MRIAKRRKMIITTMFIIARKNIILITILLNAFLLGFDFSLLMIKYDIDIFTYINI